jgi:hypothetical protein
LPIHLRRHDHTAWLTHFVRDRKPEQDFPGDDDDESGRYAGGEIDLDAKAFEVLNTIIRLGDLTPGYSFRKGCTTIYGSSACGRRNWNAFVCFRNLCALKGQIRKRVGLRHCISQIWVLRGGWPTSNLWAIYWQSDLYRQHLNRIKLPAKIPLSIFCKNKMDSEVWSPNKLKYAMRSLAPAH